MLPEARDRDANRVTPGTAARESNHSGRVGGGAAPAPGPGLVNTQQSARATAFRLENTAESRAIRRATKCRHRTITRARLLDEAVHLGGRRGRWLFVTLTYRDDEQWHAGDVRLFMQCMREWYRRRGVPLVNCWVMELTQRGRPHYHVVLWIPRHLHLPKPDKRGWWRKGLTRTETARNPVGYLAKYASKVPSYSAETELMHLYPKRCRISGGSCFKGDSGREWRYWIAPAWARDGLAPGTDLRRAKGGGYVVVSTGELLRSPWQYQGLSPDGKHLVFTVRDDGLAPAAPGRFSNDRTNVGGSSWQSLSSSEATQW